MWLLKIKPNFCLCIHPLTEVSGSLLHHLLYSKADRALFLTLLRLHQSFFRRSTWSWSLSICLLFPTPTWWLYYYSNEREREREREHPPKKATRRSGRNSLGGWLFFFLGFVGRWGVRTAQEWQAAPGDCLLLRKCKYCKVHESKLSNPRVFLVVQGTKQKFSYPPRICRWDGRSTGRFLDMYGRTLLVVDYRCKKLT